MIEKQYLKTVTVEREGAGPIRLAYGMVTEGMPGLDQYGLFIRNLTDGDYAEIRGISPDGAYVRELLDRLIRNHVTPCTMWDILQDLL